MTESIVKPGLEGVFAGETSICAVRPEEGKLIYRGYDLHLLAEEVSFEEVAYLLLYQRLPNQSELESFDQQLKSYRDLPPALLETLRSLPSHGPAMDTLRAATTILALYDPDLEDDSPEANLRKSMRLLARLTTLVSAQHRISQGIEVISPNPKLNHAANFLYMLRGNPPEELEVRVLDITFILYAEHEFNASTFTARVIASTLSDLYGAVTGALAALKGPLHGGANEKAMEVLLEIGDSDQAEAWVLNALKEKSASWASGTGSIKRRTQGSSWPRSGEKSWPRRKRIQGGMKFVQSWRMSSAGKRTCSRMSISTLPPYTT